MRIEPMLVPTDQDFLEEFGVEPEATDEFGGRRLRLDNDPAGEKVELTFDLSAQAASIEWWVGEVLVTTIVRDAVTNLRIVGRSRTGIEVEYGVPGYHGLLVLDVYPRVVISDRIMRGGEV